MKTVLASSDLPSMTIKTKEDRRFSTSSSRRLSSEMTMHHSSVEVYYGGAPVAVPFKWESQPGTPRVRFRETPLPPLTPPPSFLFNSPKTPNRKDSKPKGGMLHAILPRLITRKNQNYPASPASSESSSLFSPSSRYSDSASSRYTPNHKSQSRRKSFEDHDRYESPVSTLCFRIKRRSATPQPRGCNWFNNPYSVNLGVSIHDLSLLYSLWSWSLCELGVDVHEAVEENDGDNSSLVEELVGNESQGMKDDEKQGISNSGSIVHTPIACCDKDLDNDFNKKTENSKHVIVNNSFVKVVKNNNEYKSDLELIHTGFKEGREVVVFNEELNIIEICYKNAKEETSYSKYVNVVYDWMPPKCEFCKVFGHVHANSSVRPRSKEEKKQTGNVNEKQPKRIEGVKERNVNMGYRPKARENIEPVKNDGMGTNGEGVSGNNGRNNNERSGSKSPTREQWEKLEATELDEEEDVLDEVVALAKKLKITAWNVRGMCYKEIQKEAKKFIVEEKYATNHGKDRRSLLKTLLIYKTIISDHPWVLMGDWNVSLNVYDHSAGGSSKIVDMLEFKECIKKIEFEDLNSSGLHYTRIQSRLNLSSRIFNKLDRVLGNNNLWNGNIYERVLNKKAELQKIPISVDGDPHNVKLKEKKARIMKEYSTSLPDEESFLCQQAKIEWLKDEDKNKSVKVTKDVVDEFSLISGLIPNMGKCTVFFGNLYDHVKCLVKKVRSKWGKAKIAWNKICLLKQQGGLGLKDLSVWNKVLMSKHLWNLASNKESLWVKWINVIRLKWKSVWDVKIESSSSCG
ncbi:RNA-directed DNA polymerase, eukaryota, reverse transcriptase zinc-binding domain protein [Tanacetum coccineum]